METKSDNYEPVKIPDLPEIKGGVSILANKLLTWILGIIAPDNIV